jgi:hypothetical protein
MATAFDSTQDCSRKAADLRAAGYRTVIRYYSMSAWKRIGAAEAHALTRVGLRLAVTYQDRQNQVADFSEPKGRLAGQNAFNYAQSVIMQPVDSGIYFSVDFDPSEQQVTNNVIPFFDGVRSAMRAANNNTTPYRIGVYGSGRTCRMVMAAQLAEFAWLSQSTGFAEHQSFLASGNWHLNQQMPAEILGLNCDPVETNPQHADLGDFSLPEDHFGPALPPIASTSFEVNASSGLRLRAGPGTNFDILDVLPPGARVAVLATNGDWDQVDAHGRGNADGYVFGAYLRPV